MQFSYMLNSIEGTMFNVTLRFPDILPYTVTINFPEVTDQASLDVAMAEFAQQYRANFQPHPLANLVGQTIESTLVS